MSYNILLKGICCEGRWEEANELIAEMVGEVRSPSVITYNILISSLSCHGRTDHALELLDEMFGGPFKPTATIQLFLSYAKRGKSML